jgi:type II secretory pathway pseudopilin PulG
MSTQRHGMTLVEVMIALVIVMGMSAGLYQMGSMARRTAEYARLSTEARSRAKEQLEEIVSYKISDLQQASYQWKTETNSSAMGYDIVRTPRVLWHAADTAIVGMSSGVYAEVHIDVVFRPPLWKTQVTNTYSMLITD